MIPDLRRLVAVVGVIAAVLHLAALPETLEDLDSVNFALGVERFDVAAHRPHPPGYPVYIAAGKVSDSLIHTLAPGWTRDRRAAVGLAVWSVLAGAVAVWVMVRLWVALGLSPLLALLASALALVSPLFWLTASRPLTDVPGLVLALTVQALLFDGLRAVRSDPSLGVPRVWWWAAAAAGAIIGVRTQTMWLTGPLLCWCAGELAARQRWRDAAALMAAAAGGVLLWFVPLVWAAGGWTAYLTALGAQGADDFVGVEMLATHPSWALLAEATGRTFRTPWLNSTLASVVLVLAGLGAVRLLRRTPRVLALMLLAFWPYCVFHLTFQETATIRYSLPLVIPIAALAMVALAALPRRAAIGLATALIGATLWVAEPALSAYGAIGAPIFRAFTELEATSGAPDQTAPTALGMHRRIASEARQALVWAGEAWPFLRLKSERGAEVLEVVDYFRGGGAGPLWFLANPARRDLSLIDARARTLQSRYRWHEDTRTLIAFARPTDVDAWVITRPRWMLGRGWAVTPEIGGVTAALGLGPHRAPAPAYLRRNAAPLRLAIGGRHLGGADSPPVTLVAILDGVTLARWTVTPDARQFLQRIALPDGVPSGADPYATLSVSVDGDEPAPAVGLEFFDAATPDDVLWTYGPGWHEPELDPGTGVAWRWMSGTGRLQVEGPRRDLELTISGESSLRYFADASDLVVLVGDVEVARRRLMSDFSEVIPLPSDELARSGGAVTLRVSQSYVPADRGQGQDRRELGVRVFRLTVR